MRWKARSVKDYPKKVFLFIPRWIDGYYYWLCYAEKYIVANNWAGTEFNYRLEGE